MLRVSPRFPIFQIHAQKPSPIHQINIFWYILWLFYYFLYWLQLFYPDTTKFCTLSCQNPPWRDTVSLYSDTAWLEGKLAFYFYSGEATVLTTVEFFSLQAQKEINFSLKEKGEKI